MKKTTEKETHCKQCGTCCRKGGPSLHIEDKKILQAGHIGFQNLITLRKNELAFNPVTQKVEALRDELIKIKGKGKDWCCTFLNERENLCSIYQHRPLECKLLQCWDPTELIGIIGKHTLKRADLINDDDPIRRLIEIHERECSIEVVASIAAELDQENKERKLEELTEYVHKDITIRWHAFSEMGLAEEHEFFIFGRPLFLYLMGLGISATEETNGIVLHWQPSGQ